MVKQIPLQNGMVGLVDDEDYERINEYVWSIGNASKTRNFYVYNTQVGQLKRFILGIKDNKHKVTFKDKNHLNFKKDNLIVTEQVSVVRNTKSLRNFTSKYKGVCWDKSRNKWSAGIIINGIKFFLGRYVNEDDAARAYNRAVLEHLEGQAYMNVIGKDNSVETFELIKKKQRQRKNKTGFKGVAKRKNKYQARIFYNGEVISLGYFDIPEKAAEAYDEKAKEFFGDNAVLNFS